MYTKPAIWIVVRWPMLALECLAHCTTEQPFAIHQRQRIYLANGAALSEGVQHNMSATQARALLANIHIAMRDRAREKTCFNALLEPLYRITPHLQAVHAEDQRRSEYAVALEVSSCLNLFGSWNNLLSHLETQLNTLPYQSTYAAGHTQEAAWLLTWSSEHNPYIDTAVQWQEQLKKLSIRHLVFFPKQVEQLERMGFTSLDELWLQVFSSAGQANYSALQKRFGAAFSDYTKALFNLPTHTHKPHYQPPETFLEQIEFDYPVSNTEWLLSACQKLLDQLSLFLVQRNQHTQHIVWHLRDRENNHHKLPVSSCTASQKGTLFYELSRILFEQQALPFAVDELTLECRQIQSAAAKVFDLFTPQADSENRIEQEKIATKIGARLGSNALVKISALDEHLPERNQTTASVLLPCPATKQPSTSGMRLLRPTWMIDPPKMIHQKQRRLFWHGYLTVERGPERITGPWWQKAEERDYFLALRDDFVRCWIFYERVQKTWYIQGFFS